MPYYQRYIKHQLPQNPTTYLILLLASVVAVVAITFLLQISEYGEDLFRQILSHNVYLGFIITPISVVFIVYTGEKFFPFVNGSGIPQVLAATSSNNKYLRYQLLSFRIAIAKIFYIFIAALGGAPIGIGGPSVHIGASIFYGFNRYIKLKRKLLIHGLMAIGGSAGLIVAFNAPLGGFLFSYEELGRNLKKQALIIIAIISALVFLLSLIYRGNKPYLLDLSSYNLDLLIVWQLVPMIIITAITGAIFARATILLINKITAQKPVFLIILVFLLGVLIAVFNTLSDGAISGSGREEVLLMLNEGSLGLDFVVMKYLAVLTTLASSIAGGLFMPSIAIGAGIGAESASFYSQISPQIVIIMAMVGYLSAVISAPLTATFVVLEMTNTLHLMLPALVIAFGNYWLAKQINPTPLYKTLAEILIKPK